jgi:hypothetical protein
MFVGGPLNTVARVRAENGDAAAFRLMQAQDHVGGAASHRTLHADRQD